MSEFNPGEESHGYRERVKRRRTRRELLGISTRPAPTLPEKQKPIEESSAPAKELTRRSFIKKVAVVSGIVGGALSLDTLKGVGEWMDELYNVPRNAIEAINFLEETDLQLPQDPLYGFTFPSTKEMAQKYREALLKNLDDNPARSRWLIIIQKKEPRSSIIQFLRLFESEWKKDSRKDPKISKPESGKNESVYIELPPWMEKYPREQLAKTFYHEGFHLFYQPFYPPASDEEVFNREIPTNISEILLGRALSLRTGEEYFEIDIDRGYDRAVRENNRGLFEKELRKLYQLPEDCCTYQQRELLQDRK